MPGYKSTSVWSVHKVLIETFIHTRSEHLQTEDAASVYQVVNSVSISF